jgi:hypothetical protein
MIDVLVDAGWTYKHEYAVTKSPQNSTEFDWYVGKWVSSKKLEQVPIFGWNGQQWLPQQLFLATVLPNKPWVYLGEVHPTSYWAILAATKG